jgi:predicted RecA/RadA family phage recombinase
MKNQVFTGTPTSRRFALCPSSIVAGQPVLLGKIPAVALDNYQANTGGTTFLLNGSFNLTVVGATVLSPQTSHQINPGDKVYADGGTTDGPTNVTYGFTLDAASGGAFFGNLDPSAPAVTSGTTSTTAVVEIVTGG